MERAVRHPGPSLLILLQCPEQLGAHSKTPLGAIFIYIFSVSFSFEMSLDYFDQFSMRGISVSKSVCFLQWKEF